MISEHASVDGDHLTGDIRGIIRAEETDHFCHFLRFADPGHGNDILNPLNRCIFDHLRFNQTRCDHIHSDPDSGHFRGNGATRGNQPRFCRRIIGLAAVGDETRNG